MSILNNIITIMKNQNLSQKEFCSHLGLGQQAFTNWKNGNNNSYMKHLPKIAEILGVSVDYLLGRTVEDYAPSVAKDFTTFPVIGEVAAGYDHIAYEDFEGETIDIPNSYFKGRPKEDFFVLKVKGDSMFPTYMDGDKVLVLKQNTHREFGMWAMMLLCTGMRRGELAAIQKKDIDFVAKTISISKSVEYIHNQPHIKTPKTQHSIRTVPVIDILFQPLAIYCKSLQPEDYLFGSEKPYSLTMLRKRWNKYLKALDISITQHQLRHAHCFLLYRAGVDVKTAQYLLGHSDYTTTMNIYRFRQT